MPSLMDREKERDIITSIISRAWIISFSDCCCCNDIDCLRQKLELICEEGTAPPYLDCENILLCMNGEEQEIMKCGASSVLK